MDNSEVIMNFAVPKETPSIIKVVGVGGGGGNAVTHMYKEGIRDVTFAICNTDNQALIKSDVPVRIQIGKETTKGLGAGNKPDVARKAAEESANILKKMFSDGTEMVFITAGMGGGTGTGAAPIVAKIAKEAGILTVGIVTIPFLFEGMPKIIKALNGVEEMSKNVDALLVINNERLSEVYADYNILNAFKKADDILRMAAKSIAEIITVSGIINLDFADVNTTLRSGGVAIMSNGLGAGEDRLAIAIDNALNSPLLNNNDTFKAKKILLNFSFSESNPLTIGEMEEVNNFMAKFGRDIDLIWGAAVDNDLGNNVKVTILATGFGIENIPMMTEKLEADKEQKSIDEARLIEKYYGKRGLRRIGETTRPKPFIFTNDDMDNDTIIEAIITRPAFNRNPREIRSVIEKERSKLDPFYATDNKISNPEDIIQF
ncbi:MAG: cell division protein FtsZ [Dysgonamonadaceae bacterium]|nr:cell division protein FtsZ [Dysgonamonadaceae bacterium]